MLSFESEVAELNNKVDVLTKDRADRRAMVETGEDPVETAMRLKTELACLEEELHRTFEDLNVTKPKVRELDMELQLSKQEHTKLKEVLALAEASLTSKRGSDGSKETLQQLQQLWEELGIDAKIREQDMNDIQSSFKDTCSKKLNEAIAMKYETEKKTLQLSHRLVSMQKALGITSADSIQQQSSLNLSDRLCKLCTQVDQIEIPYKYASARRERIIMVTNELSATLGLSLVQLPSNLRVLMQQTANDSNSTTDIGRRRRASMMEGLKTVLDAIDGFGEKPDIEGVLGGESECSSGEDGNSTRFVVLPANSLESDFLSGCESEIADLRVKKSEFLVRSRELQQEVSCLVRDMHLSVRDSMVVLEESAQKKERVFPKWWSKEQTESILRVLTTSAEQISSSSDLQHLELIHETFVGVANCRRSFINALRNIVESAQETLLNIVGRELDASEAYASFHDALFRLPALSKDLALACISEMEALVIGVDAMTQSEIEALTVVWEALNISSKDRREFWGRVDKPRSLQGKTTPFDKFEDDLVSDSEEWIIPGFEKAMKVYRELDGKLRKLNCIHEEVEKLRSRQDTKSQILSLDSEVRILNVKLQDFEDLKCNKNRLLTKKNSGTSLLKEERFRKQMQGKFVSKLGQLSSLLRSWEINEGRAFDASLLSDDVRVLLDEPDKMENWVEKRTKLMPLRTVQAKTPAQKGPHETVVSKSIGVKRSAPLSRHISDITPPRKRIATAKSRSNAEQNVGRANGITKSVLSSNKRKVTSKPISSGENKEMRSQDELSTSKTSTKRLKRKEPTTLPPFGRILSEVTSPVSDVKENSRD